MPSVDVVWKGNCRAILIRSALEWARRTAIVAHGRTCLHRVRPQAPRASPRYKPPDPCPSSPTRGSADGPRRRSLRDRRVAPGQAAAPGPESPRQRAPNLRASDRILVGVCSLFMRPARVIRSAIVLKPPTILDFHRILRPRKYRLLFSPKRRGRTGPKGPSTELVDAIVEMKQRNPVWGCPRDCAADRSDLRHPDRQGRCPPCARNALSAGTRLEWSVMADVPGACERQPVEHRHVSVRVRDPAKPLGAGGHGPIHSADRRLRYPCRSRG